MKPVLYLAAMTFIAVSCSNSDAKQDAQRMAELFCKQNKIVVEAKDLSDSLIIKQLEKIEQEANEISKEIETKYANDSKAMELFSKTYQEHILNCK